MILACHVLRSSVAREVAGHSTWTGFSAPTGAAWSHQAPTPTAASSPRHQAACPGPAGPHHPRAACPSACPGPAARHHWTAAATSCANCGKGSVPATPPGGPTPHSPPATPRSPDPAQRTQRTQRQDTADQTQATHDHDTPARIKPTRSTTAMKTKLAQPANPDHGS